MLSTAYNLFSYKNDDSDPNNLKLLYHGHSAQYELLDHNCVNKSYFNVDRTVMQYFKNNIKQIIMQSNYSLILTKNGDVFFRGRVYGMGINISKKEFFKCNGNININKMLNVGFDHYFCQNYMIDFDGKIWHLNESLRINLCQIDYTNKFVTKIYDHDNKLKFLTASGKLYFCSPNTIVSEIIMPITIKSLQWTFYSRERNLTYLVLDTENRLYEISIKPNHTVEFQNRLFQDHNIKKYCEWHQKVYIIDVDHNLYYMRPDNIIYKCDRFWNHDENLVKIFSKEHLIIITDIGNIYYCTHPETDILVVQTRYDPFILANSSHPAIKSATK